MNRPRPLRALALPATLAAAIHAHAQPEPAAVRPASAGRIIRAFDFEERESNPFPIPQFWEQITGDPAGAGRIVYPAWNEARLEYAGETGDTHTTDPYRGEGSLTLPTRGGSTLLRLEPGVLPIFQGTDYRIAAVVRTRDLTHARAFITARFLDASGRRIPGAQTISSPIISNDEWTPVSIDLIGEAADAAFIQLDLSLLQPREFITPRLGAFQVWEQDINAAATFDDVTIAQLPRVELTTADPINTFVGDNRPVLRGLVRDLAGETLDATLVIRDIDGGVIESKITTLSTGSLDETWTPALPAYGWYEASMRVENAQGEVGASRIEFIWLPAPTVMTSMDEALARSNSRARTAPTLSPDRNRFALSIATLPPASNTTIPRLVEIAGSGIVSLPAFDHRAAAPPSEQNLYPAIDALLIGGREVTLSLPAAPLASAGYGDAWTTLCGDAANWMPAMSPLLEKYGQRIRSWQIGPIADGGAFWRAQPAAEAESIRQGLSALVTGPVIAIPTSVTLDWPDRVLRDLGSEAELFALAPADLTPEGLGLFVSMWHADAASAGAAPWLNIFLDTSRDPAEDRRAAAADLTRRAVEVWKRAFSTQGPAPALGLHEPWTISKGPRPTPMPAPELAAWRNLIDRIADRRYAGEFPVGDGVTCSIFVPASGAEPGRGGMLVAWNRWADPDRAVLETHLGDGPIRVVDIFGNATTVTPLPAPSGQRPNCRIPIGAEPIFIEGVDAHLVRMIAVARLESNTNEQERFILVENPWPRAVAGSLTIVEPGLDGNGIRDRSWRISPRLSRFMLQTDESTRLPVRFAFNPAQEVNTRDLVLNLELSDLDGGFIQIRRSLDIALSTMRVDLAYITGGENGEDVVIEAAISNTGEAPLTLDLTAFAPDLPRSKTTVTELLPGRQTVRRFTFEGAFDRIRGQRIVVSVADVYSGAALTRSVEIR